jgi:glycosyltransferase involved in cell wall biosynthesis
MEFLFGDVREKLADKFTFREVIAPCESNGLIKRLTIAFHAQQHQGDVTHITGDITFAALFLRPHSTIITVHDCGILKRKKGLRKWLLKKLWFEWPMRRARFITTVSQSAANDLVSECRFNPDKLHVIPNAISEKFQFIPRAFPTETPRLLQIGTAPNKNLPRLIRAIKGLNVELTIIGKLSETDKNELMNSQIRFQNLMSLSLEQVVEEYQKADIVCFASLYEGFGLPILEAQATGRPVITSNRCSMPDVAGEAAVLVEPESETSIRHGILSLINNDHLRQTLVSRGLENVKRFRLSEMSQRYAELYRAILET